jgi:hypothetical protein
MRFKHFFTDSTRKICDTLVLMATNKINKEDFSKLLASPVPALIRVDWLKWFDILLEKVLFHTDAFRITNKSRSILNKHMHCWQFRKTFYRYIDSVSFHLLDSTTHKHFLTKTDSKMKVVFLPTRLNFSTGLVPPLIRISFVTVKHPYVGTSLTKALRQSECLAADRPINFFAGNEPL